MEWIKCSDRLPREGDEVWAFMIDERYEQDEANERLQAVCVHNGEYGWHTPFDDVDDRINVTHWMPLPEPTKE